MAGGPGFNYHPNGAAAFMPHPGAALPGGYGAPAVGLLPMQGGGGGVLWPHGQQPIPQPQGVPARMGGGGPQLGGGGAYVQQQPPHLSPAHLQQQQVMMAQQQQGMGLPPQVAVPAVMTPPQGTPLPLVVS
jgi:hypothetical protein